MSSATAATPPLLLLVSRSCSSVITHLTSPLEPELAQRSSCANTFGTPMYVPSAHREAAGRREAPALMVMFVAMFIDVVCSVNKNVLLHG